MPIRALLSLTFVLLLLSCSANAPKASITTPSPAALQLSSDPAGTASASFTFRNKGDSDLDFTLSSNVSWLSTLPRSGTLLPDESRTVGLQASCPDMAITRSATVSIVTNDPDTPVSTVKVTLSCGEAETAADESGYNIDVRFAGDGFTPSREAVFMKAAARWSTVITGDLPAVSISKAADSCGPAFAGDIDDLVIYAVLRPIDGPGGVLGQAGPCYIRQEGSRLPVFGIMEFDSDDVAALEAEGQFEAVILHEMGHVLGIGTLWDAISYGHDHLEYQGDGQTCMTTETFTVAPTFTGDAATAEFAVLGGSGQAAAEEGYGQGTKCGHWDEAMFTNELMTGYLDHGNAIPLSRLTVASLADMGYVVDYTSVDPYVLQPCAPDCLQMQGEALRIKEILLYPQGVVTPDGKIMPLSGALE